MVLSYDYSSQNWRRRRTNAPPLRAILMTMAVRRCNTERFSMQHDRGFTGSYRTLPSDDYSLRITPAAARATINTTIMEHMYPLFWPF